MVRACTERKRHLAKKGIYNGNELQERRKEKEKEKEKEKKVPGIEVAR